MMGMLKDPFSFFAYHNKVWRLLDKTGRSILDVGCGRGSFMRIINGRRKFFTVGCDLYLPFLKECKQNKIYDEHVLCDARFLPFRRCAFDIVLCLEVIEHLPKKDSLRLLKQMEEIAQQQIVISTPIGFKKQFQDLVSQNPFQTHKCGWTLKELKKLGFNDFLGDGFFLYDRLRGDAGSPFLFIRKIISVIISYLLNPITSFRLSLAYSVICAKNVHKQRNDKL